MPDSETNSEVSPLPSPLCGLQVTRGHQACMTSTFTHMSPFMKALYFFGEKHVPQSMWRVKIRGQLVRLVPSLHTWALEIELKSLGLAARAITCSVMLSVPHYKSC